jgi:hypothetical protein
MTGMTMIQLWRYSLDLVKESNRIAGCWMETDIGHGGHPIRFDRKSEIPSMYFSHGYVPYRHEKSQSIFQRNKKSMLHGCCFNSVVSQMTHLGHNII